MVLMIVEPIQGKIWKEIFGKPEEEKEREREREEKMENDEEGKKTRNGKNRGE